MASDPAKTDELAAEIEPVKARFSTISGVELQECYGPGDVSGEIGEPGEYPFTRGVHRSMYRGKGWTSQALLVDVK